MLKLDIIKIFDTIVSQNITVAIIFIGKLTHWYFEGFILMCNVKCCTDIKHTNVYTPHLFDQY